MKPMLAKKFNEHRDKVEFPCFVQPKLNGIRALYWNGKMQSRDGHFFDESVVKHITDKLESVGSDYILDGELYVHGWSLQKINGAIAVNRKEKNDLSALVSYHVFDCINVMYPDMVFNVRDLHWSKIYEKLGQPANVQVVDTRTIFSHSEGEKLFSLYKAQGYEGMMYRLNEPYGLTEKCGNKENRWHVLLKRKDWLDEDCTIIGVEQGTGKYADCVGSLLLEFPDNGVLFHAGSGLSDMQRLKYMTNPPVGKVAKIKYEMLSDAGVPLKPTIELVND